MIPLVRFAENALNLNALEWLEPREAPETLTADAQLVLGIGLIERVHVQVVEADTIVNDLDAADRRRVVVQELVIPLDLHDNATHVRRAGAIADRLKRVHHSFEDRQERLPFRELRLSDQIPDVGT